MNAGPISTIFASSLMMGARLLKRIDRLALRLLGIRAILGVVLVVVGCVAGATVGWRFPKFEATAMLQFPDWTEKLQFSDLTEKEKERVKQNLIDLQTYKRIAASYDSPVMLATYLQKAGEEKSAAGQVLLEQAQRANFWGERVAPVLPFTKRDQRQFGDLKDMAANALIGVDLNASASSEATAAQMVQLLANYVADAVVRERVRSWILAHKAWTVSAEENARAEILRAELDIELNARRANDMKSIIARYPEAARMDERQVLRISPLEGAERFFSPLTQLVGAESAISQRRERIVRLERELHQVRLSAPYYVAAETVVNENSDVGRLIAALRDLTGRTFLQSELKEDWAVEAVLGIRGTLDGFAEMRNQVGIRSDVRSRFASSRDPFRLFLLGGAMALGLLASVAVLRSVSINGFKDDSDDLLPPEHTRAVAIRTEGPHPER